MTWTPLTQLVDLDLLDERSRTVPVLVFKHSTRCSISSTARFRLERAWSGTAPDRPLYLLDLLRYRTLSDAIAQRYQVEHASPQVLVIHRGQCVYDASHFGITPNAVEAALAPR